MRIVHSVVVLSAILGLLGSSCAPASDADAETQSDQQRATDAAASASPELRATIRAFETAGGRGTWFVSESPFDRTVGAYYLVDVLPKTVDPKASVYALRMQHSKDFLDAVVERGVPIVLGDIDLRTQVEAAALGGFKLVDDALAAGKIDKAKDILLLKPTADKFLIAHEYRHWQDYADPQFESDFEREMKPYLEADYLDAAEKKALLRLVWEIRGHATQRLQVLADRAAHLPELNAQGYPVAGISLDGIYDGAISVALSTFMMAYSQTIRQIANKIDANDPKGKQGFVDAASKFDLSDQPDNTLTFRAVLGM